MTGHETGVSILTGEDIGAQRAKMTYVGHEPRVGRDRN